MERIRPRNKKRNLQKIKADGVLYLLLLPTILYFFVFHVIPIVGMRLAFYDAKAMSDDVFVGMKHFQKLFSTPIFFRILKNTIIISAMKIFLFFPLPILFALMLNEFKAGIFRKSIQVIAYLPHFLSWVVIAGIWIEFLSPTKGGLNGILGSFGFKSVDLLADKSAIRWILLASESWRSIGWDSIVYFVAIIGIDGALYEAARIDGATRVKIIHHIILPTLVTTMVTVLILNIGFFMSAGMDQVINFSNDAVNSKIDIIDTYVYRIGLQNSQYSLGTAASVFKGLIGTILIISTNFLSKKLTGNGAW